MPSILRPSPVQVEISKGDVRTLQRHRTWAQFKHLQKGFENSIGVRLSYYDGTIEILMPGEAHELFKSLIGFLVELLLRTNTKTISFVPLQSQDGGQRPQRMA